MNPFYSFLILAGALAWPVLSFAQSPSESLDELKEAYHQRADFDRGRRELPALIETFRATGAWSELAEAQLYLGECQYELLESAAAEKSFLAAYTTVQERGLDSTQLDYYYLILQALAVIAPGGSTEEAALYERLTAFVERHFPDDRRARADALLGQAVLDYRNGNYAAALAKAELGVETGKHSYTHWELSLVHNNLATLYAEGYDYERALSNQKLSTLRSITPYYRAENLINEVTLLTELRKFPTAEKRLDEALAVIETNLSADSDLYPPIYAAYCDLYNEINDLAAFERVLLKWESFYAQFPTYRATYNYQRYHNFRASYYIRRREAPRAAASLLNSKTAEEEFGQDYALATGRLLLESKVDAMRQDFPPATLKMFLLLSYESLQSPSGATEADHDFVFAADSLYNSLYVVGLLKDRAALYSRRHLETRSVADRDLAYAQLAVADTLLQRLRNDYPQLGFRRQLNELAMALARVEIGVAWRSYQENPSRTVFERALNASERIKYLGISEEIVAGQDTNYQRWRAESYRIDSLLRETIAAGNDTARVASLREATERLRKRQEERRKTTASRTETEGKEPLTVAAIRANLLAPNEVLLHFVEQDSQAYVLVVGREELAFERLEARSSFQETAQQLQKGMLERDEAVYPVLEGLYADLIAPLTPLLGGKSLVLVPDGYLSYLPFAAFVNGGKYLVEEYEIRYLFNARYLLLQRQRGLPERELLSLAPFSDAGFDGLKPLPFSRNVQTYLTELLGHGRHRALSSREANRDALLQRAAGFNVLHFATHATPTALLLSPTDEGIRKEVTPNEVGKLDLVADLAFVSACATADGRFYRGSGIDNLAQAFAYGGCDNMIVNLWEVVDETSYYLSKSFYRGVYEDGLPKHRALRAAQLEYLADRPMTRHPAFWATMIYYGDELALRKIASRRPSWMWPFLGVIALLIGTLGWWWQQR